MNTEKWVKLSKLGGKYSNCENYSVSNTGLIRNDRFNKILSGTISDEGYKVVHLGDTHKHSIRCDVHRAVALAFIPNDEPNIKVCINHKDENKLNNFVDNLEWCTYEYNNNYGTKKQRISETMRKNQTTVGKNNGMYGRHHTEESKQKLSQTRIQNGTGAGINNPRCRAVVMLTMLGEYVKEFEYIKLVEAEGFSSVGVIDCCKHRNKSHKGYIWVYKEEYIKGVEQ